MHIIMNDTPIKTIEHVRQFLNGVGAIEFSIEGKDARYAWIQTLLRRFHYHQLGKPEKGLLLDFLQKVSGYSRIQVKRLSQQYLQTGHLQRRQRTVQGFRRTYTLEDIRLLAQTDELHGTLSGPATKKLCERAWTHFGQTEYHRLAGISVAYLYILRHSTPYQRVRQHFDKRPSRHADQSLVIGLTGAWGSGKSSIVNLLTEHLSRKALGAQQPQIIEFNPWLFAGEEKLIEHLLHDRVQAAGTNILGVLVHHHRVGRDRLYGVIGELELDSFSR